MSLDPKADARDARFYRWFAAQSPHELSLEAEKSVWDEAWRQALEWERMESGR